MIYEDATNLKIKNQQLETFFEQLQSRNEHLFLSVCVQFEISVLLLLMISP